MDDDLTTPYVPVLVHYADSDAIEYVTEDAGVFYERLDHNLDIVRQLETGKIIGFRLNWWRHHRKDLQKQDVI